MVKNMMKRDVEQIEEIEQIEEFKETEETVTEAEQKINNPYELAFFEDKVLRKQYEEAIYILLQAIRRFKDEKEAELGRDIVSHTRQRMKTYDSVVNKLKKKKCPITDTAVEANINDLAGIRVVCLFIDDIYMVRDFIKTVPGIRVIKIKDYVKKPRKTGYQSIHMIVQFETGIKVEIQIRSMAMDFWSVLEYQLQYKKKKNIKSLKKDLYECASDIRSIEQRMLDLRESIEKAK